MLKATGGTGCEVFETVRYSSYGVQFGIPPGDVDGDGDNDDNENWPGGYAVRCDYNLDGVLDELDQNFTIANTGRTLGRGVLSHSSVANRRGYSGGEHDGTIDTLAHVRHRALLTELGRWTRRDPLGYMDGMGLYSYGVLRPAVVVDWSGLAVNDPLGAGNVSARRPSSNPHDVVVPPDDGPIGPCVGCACFQQHHPGRLCTDCGTEWDYRTQRGQLCEPGYMYGCRAVLTGGVHCLPICFRCIPPCPDQTCLAVVGASESDLCFSTCRCPYSTGHQQCGGTLAACFGLPECNGP